MTADQFLVGLAVAIALQVASLGVLPQLAIVVVAFLLLGPMGAIGASSWWLLISTMKGITRSQGAKKGTQKKRKSR